MNRSHKALIAKWFGLDIPGRGVKVREDDRFIVSYPRSGNTWLRFLVGNLISSEEVSFRTIETLVPDIYQNSSRYLEGLKSPRYLKSHEPLDPRYPRVIYLVRDPRDVCVSLYYYHLKNRWIEWDESMEEFSGRFLKGDLRGNYGTWGENVESWLDARTGHPSFVLVRYEDLLSAPLPALRAISQYLGLSSGIGQLQSAIERSGLVAMQEMEDRQAGEWRPTRGTDPNVRFIRGTGTGSWMDSLPLTSAEAIYRTWGETMKKLGYEAGKQ